MSAACLLALSFVVLADDTAVPSLAPDETPPPLEVAQRYYRVINSTGLEVDLGQWFIDRKIRSNLHMSILWTGKGRSKLSKVGLVVLNFSAASRGPDRRYRNNHAVTIRADGRVVPLREDR